MSVHCCNRYYEIDEEFCRLIKDTGEYNGDWSDLDSFEFLMDEVKDKELLKKLEGARRTGNVCPHCWGKL